MSAINMAAKKLVGQIAEIQDDRARLKEQLGISEKERLVRIFKLVVLYNFAKITRYIIGPCIDTKYHLLKGTVTL